MTSTTLQYTCKHVPTGKMFPRTLELELPRRLAVQHLLRCLNDWNRLGNGIWAYWTDEATVAEFWGN